jgi:hypothetical protein
VSKSPPDYSSWKPSERSDDLPAWDQDEADGLVGLYVLVGITHLNVSGETVISQTQYHGRIVDADPKAGFKVECEGEWKDHLMGLPPDINVFTAAKPGQYRLRSTEEIVENPDLLAAWSVKGSVIS